MSKIAANLKFLRKEKAKTQTQLSEILGITRPQLGSYEEGRAEPRLEVLGKMASYFELSIDDLIHRDLSKGFKPGQSGPKVLAITVNEQNEETIQLIPKKAAAGYQSQFDNPEYLSELPSFKIPNLGPGTYRAFEISGDSMLPMQPGTIIIGQYVEELEHIKNNKTYIILDKNDGLVYKRVQNTVKEKGTLTLISDSKVYLPYEINAEDILEVWEAKLFISSQFPEENFDIKKLTDIVMDLQQEVIKLKGK